MTCNSDCSQQSCVNNNNIIINTRVGAESSDDDIWLSSDNEQNNESNFHPNTDESYGVTQNDPTHINMISLKRKHAKQGYLDGLARSKEEGLQEGFDEGYPIGSKLGEVVGEILASLKYALIKKRIDDSIYNSALRELNIQLVLQSTYFDSNLNINDVMKHPLIAKWSNKVSDL